MTRLGGNLLLRKGVGQQQIVVDLGNIPTGMYILTVKGEAWVERRKILVNK
ncbi:T9SS type A sorting domain-containing protein [Fibrella sp. HMF5335]|uniref:T9SS type A sorting domain-containing protein n=1 Tax=Fibrella rubiginis TaxID=2817060 RepID=A0A939K5H1_9BACT|nr:T9SS type A sorting domain-containing protein [Fibrella rubiginis]